MGKGVDISKKKDKRQRERSIRLQISEDSRVRQARHNKWVKQQNPIVGDLGLDRLELEDDEPDQQQREDDEGDQHEDDQQLREDDEGDQMMRVTSMRMTSSSLMRMMRVTSMRMTSSSMMRMMMRVTSSRMMRVTCLSAAQLPTTEAQPPLVQLEVQPPLAQLVLAQRPTTEAQLQSV